MDNEELVFRLRDEFSAQFRAMQTNASASMGKLQAGVDDVKTSLTKLEPSAGAVTTRMIAMGTAIGTFIGRVADDALRKMTDSMGRMIQTGLELRPVTDSFEALTGGIGESAAVMLSTSRNATKGLITDLDLMAASNKAMLLNLPITSSEMATLGKTAVVLGRAMKQDATKSLDDLITALGRSSPLILDNLGLTVKVGEANEAYALKLGKSSTALTDAEKKMAFYEAAMEAAEKKVAQLGEVHLTLKDRASQAMTGMTNVVARWISGLNEADPKTLGFTASLGAIALGMASTLPMAMGVTSTALVTMQAGLAAARIGFTAMWAAATGPVGIVTAALAAVAGLLAWFVTKNADSALAQQTNAAQAEMMAKASEIAGRAVTDYGEAVGILEGKLDGVAIAQGMAAAQAKRYGDTLAIGMRAIQAEALTNTTLREREEQYWRELGQLAPRTLDTIVKSIRNGQMTAKDWVDTLAKAGVVITQESIQRALKGIEDKQKSVTEATKKHTEALKATEDEARRLQDAFDKIYGYDKIQQFREMITTVGGFPDVARMSKEAIADWNLKSNEAIEIAKRTGHTVPGTWVAIKLATDQAKFAAVDVQKVWEAIYRTFGALEARPLNITPSMDIGRMGPSPAVEDANKLGTALSGVSRILDGINSKFAQMASLVSRTVQVLVDPKASLVDKVVAVATTAIDFIFRIGDSARDKVTKAIKEQREQLGELGREAGKFGIRMDAVFSARNLDAFNYALKQVRTRVDELNSAMERYNVTWRDFQGTKKLEEFDEQVRQVNLDVGRLEAIGLSHESAVRKAAQAYIDLGIEAMETLGEIPDSLAPIILEMAKMGAITEDNARKLLGLKDENEVDFRAMQAAAEKYGISLDSLGPKFEAARLGDIAKGLITDWDLLTQGGADVNAVIEKMRPSVQGVIDKALKLGIEVPANMKPMLDKFVEAGVLVDGNGQKLTDLSGIKFSTPLESAIQLLIDKMQQLIDKISGVGSSLNNLPESVTVGVNFAAGQFPGLGVDSMGNPIYFHKGGMVAARRAHNGWMVVKGGLKSGEVPVVAQDGEAFLSRKAVAMIGGAPAVNAMNGGQMPVVSSSGPSNAEVVKEVRGLRGDLRDLPYLLTKSLKTARAV